MGLRQRLHTAAANRRAPARQPAYDDEVSQDYLDALQRRLDEEKGPNFKLTPICEPGW